MKPGLPGGSAALLSAFVLLLIAGPASAQVSKFRYEPDRIEIGTLYIYKKSNIDGSHAGRRVARPVALARIHASLLELSGAAAAADSNGSLWLGVDSGSEPPPVPVFLERPHYSHRAAERRGLTDWGPMTGVVLGGALSGGHKFLAPWIRKKLGKPKRHKFICANCRKTIEVEYTADPCPKCGRTPHEVTSRG